MAGKGKYRYKRKAPKKMTASVAVVKAEVKKQTNKKLETKEFSS